MGYLDNYDPENLLQPKDVDLSTLMTVREMAKELKLSSAIIYRFCTNYRENKGMWKLPHVLIGESQTKFIPRSVVVEFNDAYLPGRYQAARRKRPKGSGTDGSAEAS